jgi:8-oxo-dGTP pyrophosphatase MutT (NUDIX family)
VTVAGQLSRRLLATRLAGFPRSAADRPDLKQAAVAVVVTEHEGRPALVVTRRAARLRAHGGQWALPGGRRDDGESAVDGALREMREEIGLALPRDSVLGALDDYVTRSGYVMTPVVCWAGDVGGLSGAEEEVAAVHQVPLEDFDVEPGFVRIPESEALVIQLPLFDRLLHAPTAAILHQFCRIACRAQVVRVAHFEQPVFAWK